MFGGSWSVNRRAFQIAILIFFPQKNKTAQFCISYLQVFYGVGRKRFYDGIMRDKKLRRVNLVCQIYSVPLTEEQEVKFLGKFEPH